MEGYSRRACQELQEAAALGQHRQGGGVPLRVGRAVHVEGVAVGGGRALHKGQRAGRVAA